MTTKPTEAATAAATRVPMKLRRRRPSRKAIAAYVGAGVAFGMVSIYASQPNDAAAAHVATTSGQHIDIPARNGLAILAGPHSQIEPGTRSVVAWVSESNACYGTVNLANPADSSVNCVPEPGGSPGDPRLWSKPHLISSAQDMSPTAITAIGFVQGSVASVTVTMKSGQRESAPVIPVPNTASRVGSYVVRLPLSAGRISWTDVANVTAFDAEGTVLTQITGS